MCGAPCFFASKEAIISMHWIIDVDSSFLTSFCPTEANIIFVTCILCDRVKDWWCEVFHGLEPDVVESLS